MSAMSGLGRVWKSKDIRFISKMKLFKTLVLSILLYGCESCTMTADLEKRIQAFENKCFRRLLQIPWFEHKTNMFVQEQVETLAGPQEPLLAVVKRRKLTWFGHVTHHNSLSKTILQGTIEGGRRRGRQRKSRVEDVKNWTNLDMPQLLTQAMDRSRWRRLSVTSSLMSPLRPSILRN